MATALANHAPILPYQTVSGNTDNTDSQNEKAGQTFLAGTPVQLNAGVIQEWDGVTVANGIAGIALIDASNYATDGQGAPAPFTPVGFPGAIGTFGSVPNEPNAVNIARGEPFATGQTLFNKAINDTLFIGQVDNANASTGGSVTPTQATLGSQFGLTKDADGHWYIDFNKTTPGTNTVVEIVNFTIDGLIANARLIFRFLNSASQYAS